jgi:hypothetical protein
MIFVLQHCKKTINRIPLLRFSYSSETLCRNILEMHLAIF